jgi:hypothetical protein
MVAGGTAAITSLSGCSGILGSNEPDGTTEEGPEPPLTPEELAAEVPDDATITIYTAPGSPGSWENLVSIVSDEFDVDLDSEVFVSDTGVISQRVIQERQADSDKVDVLRQADEINERFQSEGTELIRK